MCEILSFYINIFLFVLLMLLYRINWKKKEKWIAALCMAELFVHIIN